MFRHFTLMKDPLSRLGPMEAREAKLRKLNSFRNSLPYASQSALAAFLARAAKGDLPQASSAKDLRAARRLDTEVCTPYGPLLTKAAGRGGHSMRERRDTNDSQPDVSTFLVCLVWVGAEKELAGCLCVPMLAQWHVPGAIDRFLSFKRMAIHC